MANSNKIKSVLFSSIPTARPDETTVLRCPVELLFPTRAGRPGRSPGTSKTPGKARVHGCRCLWEHIPLSCHAALSGEQGQWCKLPFRARAEKKLCVLKWWKWRKGVGGACLQSFDWISILRCVFQAGLLTKMRAPTAPAFPFPPPQPVMNASEQPSGWGSKPDSLNPRQNKTVPRGKKTRISEPDVSDSEPKFRSWG